MTEDLNSLPSEAQAELEEMRVKKEKEVDAEKELQLINSVLQDHQARMESGQEPYFSDGSIEALRQIPNIEVSVTDLESIKKSVSQPGTMTHTTVNYICRPSDVSPKTPALFWSELALGKKQEHLHNIEGESAVSFNITCPDGYNPSIETRGTEGGTYCLKDQKARLVDTGLVIFSKSALEKMAGYTFFNGNGNEKFGIQNIGDDIEELIDQRLHYGGWYGKAYFQNLRDSYGIEFHDYGKRMMMIAEEQNCTDLIIYAHLCLKFLNDPDTLNTILKSHDDRRGSQNIKNIIETENYRSNFGYRFRGIVWNAGKGTYQDIDPEPEDISSIAILNSKSEENYLSIDFKNHESLKPKV